MTKRQTRRRGGAETAWARGNSKPQRLRVSALIFLSLSRLEGHPLAAAQLAGALLVGLALQAAGGALRGHLRVGAGGPLRRLGRVRAPEEAEGRGQRESDSHAGPLPYSSARMTTGAGGSAPAAMARASSAASTSSTGVSTSMSRCLYALRPVPAGMRRPMITFSFRPRR